MTQAQVDYLLLDGGQTINVTELASCCDMSVADLDELVDYCALVPLSDAVPERLFSAAWIAPLREARRMRNDFDLDLFTVAIVLGNIKRIEGLERQVQQLQALLPARLRQGAPDVDGRCGG